MMGAPSSAVRGQPRSLLQGGWPTGMCASTSAVSRPHTDTSIASATPSDCE